MQHGIAKDGKMGYGNFSNLTEQQVHFFLSKGTKTDTVVIWVKHIQTEVMMDVCFKRRIGK